MIGFFSFLFDQLFPETCVVCGREITDLDSVPSVVRGAWQGEDLGFFIDASQLSDAGLSRRVICSDCLFRLERTVGDAFLPFYRYNGMKVRVVSPFFINDPLLELIHFLKFGGGKAAALSLSWWMALSLRRLFSRRSDRVTVVPVPLHRRRRVSRGYNQAEELAIGVCSALRLELITKAVIRKRHTKRQSDLPAEKRRANVKGAFELVDAEVFAKRDIVAVDDLVTTGETVTSFVKEIAGAKPHSITVLSAARSRNLP